MFPGSAVPRAKIRMTLGQQLASPFSSSVRVVAARFDRGAVKATDAAAASVLRMLLNFILRLGWGGIFPGVLQAESLRITRMDGGVVETVC